jgi:hypothetical protein
LFAIPKDVLSGIQYLLDICLTGNFSICTIRISNFKKAIMNFKSYFIHLVIVVGIAGCENSMNPVNCIEENKVALEPIKVEGFNPESCRLVDTTKEQEYRVIIKSKTEFDKYINCSINAPDVDFNKYFILAGSYNHRQCATLDNQQISICSDALVYNVNLREQDCLAVTRVYYFAIVENKYSNLPVTFEIEFLK